MTTSATEPTLRESVDELVLRLGRICAAAATLRNLASNIRHGISPHTLIRLSEDLDRDLMLASREVAGSTTVPSASCRRSATGRANRDHGTGHHRRRRCADHA